ncbi:intraflagellar transport protein 74 homolog [Plakobranchus ocellatus]|uniref:Intraflagellar transport protein 74 homolog n=1 Tax=Plakobranchus ocellatus TaxID=259542 RepID=A0AAV3Y9F2_9GAST|nr:intraflagellar transport protein 74 homolog [Plakobranchus ocellatus]
MASELKGAAAAQKNKPSFIHASYLDMEYRQQLDFKEQNNSITAIRSQRPPTSSARPITGRPIGTAMGGRQPGTATRLTTAMNPGTARPGSRGGAVAGGVALNAQVTVVDRPVTQQGLGGMKTAAKGGRLVQDKSYYLGLVRSKINELHSENARLNKDIENASDENSSFLTYEKRAEALASEIRDLQGELGDYNTLVDKLTTDEDIHDVEFDCENLKTENDRNAKRMEDGFEMKKQREDQIQMLETELDQEKRMADSLVNDMDPNLRQRYLQLKDMNEHALKQLEIGRQELDMCNSKIENLQEELSLSQVKQEAVRLYDQLHELEVKRDSLLEEAKSKGSPAEERESLLKQVKEDNQEIASMERQTREIQEKIDQLQEDIQQLDLDIEENQGERNQKYKELKKREESMDEFLASFEENKADEIRKIAELEQGVVTLLENMSRNMGRFTHLPTPKELMSMKADLQFKEDERQKSESTTIGLAAEREKLQHDLQKMEQFEEKLNEELVVLREKVVTMEKQLDTYSDLDRLRSDADSKKQKLMDDRIILQKRRDNFKKMIQALTVRYEGLKSQLNENETYSQLMNLEKKWQHHEQNNFSMKEFISQRTMDCDFSKMSKQVHKSIDSFNSMLQAHMANKRSY